MGLSAVIFAAGSGKRMGIDKLRVPVDGVPLLARALAPYLACEAISEVIAVVRPGFAPPDVAGPVRWVENPQHADGMSASMRAGVAAADERAEGVALGLGDLPFLRPQTVAEAIEAWRAGGRAILVPVCQGRRGHPVLLGARFREALLAARGDVGAREVLRAYPGDVMLWECRDRGIADDVDTPKDLVRVPR